MTCVEAAYGFRFDGIPVPGALAAAGAEEWPRARVGLARPSGRTGPRGIHSDRALIGMPHGVITVDRRERSAVIETADPLEPAAVVHPYLWPIGVALARWAGWETFHAGAVVVGGGAWGIVGESGDGKSTLLAWLATRAGLPVLVDDL